jgi:hypothetical protein
MHLLLFAGNEREAKEKQGKGKAKQTFHKNLLSAVGIS